MAKPENKGSLRRWCQKAGFGNDIRSCAKNAASKAQSQKIKNTATRVNNHEDGTHKQIRRVANNTGYSS